MARPKTNEKPDRPYDGFPLFPHDNGQWAKKIRGKLRYFGTWDDWEAALKSFEEQRDSLQAGNEPRPSRSGLTVVELCNAFLRSKKSLLDSGELAASTLANYRTICETICQQFGNTRSVDSLTAANFDSLRSHLAGRFGPVALSQRIMMVRIVLKYGYDADLLERPVRYGPHFKRPPARVLRIEKARRGKKLFTAEEIRLAIDNADPHLKAMILLGINCGLGNADCGRLERQHIASEWLDYQRHKTGIHRRAKLWPETLVAIKDVPKRKPKRPEWSNRIFLTVHGRPWMDDKGRQPLSNQLLNLLRRIKIARPGLSFYALRHTFQTHAEESRDIPAVRSIMGHVAPLNDMSSVYREHISDERLSAVSDHLRVWLFGSTGVASGCRKKKTPRKPHGKQR